MISADVKANKTTRNKRSGSCISQIFISYKEYIPSKPEIQCKKGMYFSFDFGWYCTVSILGWGGVFCVNCCLTDQTCSV